MTTHMNLNALGAFDNNIQRLWQIAQTNATRGEMTRSVFDFLPSYVQKALVDAEILTLLYLQADDIEDSHVRELLNTLVEANNAVFAAV